MTEQTVPSLRFSTLNSEGHFWSKRRPKTSIVDPWPPKMTLKWSPKWRQGKNGRPLRYMRRHRRIACPPPSGSLIFAHFSKMQNISPQITHTTRQFNKSVPKGSQKGLLFLAQNSKKYTFWTLAPLGLQIGAPTAKITKMTSRMLPGSLFFTQQAQKNQKKGGGFPPPRLEKSTGRQVPSTKYLVPSTSTWY